MASPELAATKVDSPPGSGPVAGAGRRRAGGPFWRLWWATGISASGDGLVAVALPLLAFTLTKSPLAIAGVTAVNRAFAAIAALPAGVVADRVERRTVMIASDVTAGAVMLALVVVMTAGRASLAMVYVAAAVLAVCDVSYTLAMQAAFPDVVAADQLATANGRLMAVEGAGESFLGPGCGGFLFAMAQRLPFGVDGVSFFVSALLVKVTVPLRSSHGMHLDRGAGDAPGGIPGTDVFPSGAHRIPRVSAAERYQGRHQRRVSWTDDLRQGFRLFQREASLKLLGAAVASVTLCQAWSSLSWLSMAR